MRSRFHWLLRTALQCVILLYAMAPAGTVMPWGVSGSLTEPARNCPVSAPDSFEDDLTYLLDMTEADSSSFEPARIANLLRLLLSKESGNPKLSPADRNGSQGAFFQAHIRTPLSRIIEYSFNTDIPCNLTRPSSIRVCGWHSTSELATDFERLQSGKLGEGEYILVRGVEYMENTPDLQSGGYYRYESDRVIISFFHNGHPILITLSKQKGRSLPGKKGVVLNDDEWSYFYSGERGLTLQGLGWATTYVYDSFYISLYSELDLGAPLTRNMVFSWVKGGWSSINVINSDHIYEGLHRSVLAFKEVMESPLLPEPGRIAQVYSEVRSLSEESLRKQIEPLIGTLREASRSHPVLSRRTFADILHSQSYLNNLSREELESMIMLEYLKLQLGKDPNTHVGKWGHRQG